MLAVLILGTAGHAYAVHMDGEGMGGELWDGSVKLAGQEKDWRRGDQLGDYLTSNTFLNHSFKKYLLSTI